ncbi:MAG: hypothetical protein M1822_006432 [Bathelium mastoideum]|nr:MAG: hypothetical protein M1822_006432 [Bathelium mastoideum]
MVDVTSIVIAIVSLITSALAAGLSSWLAYTTEKRKAIREEEKILRKYRDPLALAAHDLQARLYNIFSKNGLYLANEKDQESQDSLYIYTLFLVGQYLAWRHILRQRAQFVAFTARNRSKKLIKLLDTITFTLNTGKPYGEPGMLMKSHQMAIGEIMTVRDEKEGELLCMGLSAFTRRWKAEEILIASRNRGDRHPQNHNPSDNSHLQIHQSQEVNLLPFAEVSANASDLTEDTPLHVWFRPLDAAIHYLVDRRYIHDDLNAHGARFRNLQHLLRDLVLLLDPEAETRSEFKRVDKGHGCKCSACDGQETRSGAKKSVPANHSASV